MPRIPPWPLTLLAAVPGPRLPLWLHLLSPLPSSSLVVIMMGLGALPTQSFLKGIYPGSFNSPPG